MKNKSAIKRARQSEERRLRNLHIKSTMKTLIKKFISVLESKTTGDTNESLRNAVSYIDSAASKGVIHRNNAARKISRLTKMANSALSAKV